MLQGNSPKCLRGSFSFWEKSSCSVLWLPLYKEGPVFSHSLPLQLGRGLSGSGSHAAQLSSLLGQCTWSPWGFHFGLISLPVTSGKQVFHSVAQALFGRGGGHLPGSLPVVLQQAPHRRAWDCSCPGPRVGPRDLFVLKQSPYLPFSQCPLYFLVSYLHKRWAAFGCLLCSSVDWVGVSPLCRGKLTQLPPVSPPSSLSYNPFLVISEMVFQEMAVGE